MVKMCRDHQEENKAYVTKLLIFCTLYIIVFIQSSYNVFETYFFPHRYFSLFDDLPSPKFFIYKSVISMFTVCVMIMKVLLKRP